MSIITVEPNNSVINDSKYMIYRTVDVNFTRNVPEDSESTSNSLGIKPLLTSQITQIENTED